MTWLKSLSLAIAIFASICTAADGEDAVYTGPWKTTNRKLDGTMTCAIRMVEKEKWHGRFWGTWQGVDFDYAVDFFGPSDHLDGQATIDGVAYEWKGRMNDRQFRANFGGDRYSALLTSKGTKRPGQRLAAGIDKNTPLNQLCTVGIEIASVIHATETLKKPGET